MTSTSLSPSESNEYSDVTGSGAALNSAIDVDVLSMLSPAHCVSYSSSLGRNYHCYYRHSTNLFTELLREPAKALKAEDGVL
jgi:hypothetical protein